MEWWQAVILGLVEGVTEYLPVSSTGHLILAAAALGLDTDGKKPAVDAFNIVVQGGAILAVLGLYWPRILQMVRGAAGRDPAGLRLAVNLGVAFAPAAILGFLLNDWIEAHLFSMWPVVAALGVGGVYMIVIDRAYIRGPNRERADAGAAEPDITSLTARQALLIGLLQCIAMWPGTSRSMMTITGGLIVGLRPRAAAEFSFLLGLPTLTAACGYTLLKNLLQSREEGGATLFGVLGPAPVVLGMVVAGISAGASIYWLVGFLNRRGLAPFGWYRLALCAVMVGLASAGWIRIP